MSAKKLVRCAIYTRKSTEEGLEQEFNSLDAQREGCQAYILSQKAEGWVALPDNYDDGGYSGGTLERPALKRLLKDIESGLVDVVAVYKIDRLSRSLMDFAKMVEIFDRKAVTFVSITQSFNTTTSMGRLTLNVLLSFAQFEREVIGERVRDKFAASKKKGMWMGGTPPLGYDVESRKLLINSVEAEAVCLIFQRYLDLGCVRALREDLKGKGIVSKRWVSSKDRTRGGVPLDRGALYCLLKNRLYLGETMHKGVSYPGEHEAIVPRVLFDAVQERLAAGRRRQLGKRSALQDAMLVGILFDERDSPMTPTYSVKPDGRRYRYYTSQSRSKGESSKASITRVPAAPLEEVVSRVLTRLRLPTFRANQTDDERTHPLKVQIKRDSVVINLNRQYALDAWCSAEPSLSDAELLRRVRGELHEGEAFSADQDELMLTLPMRARFRGGRATVLHPPGEQHRPAGPDAALIKALARAHRWREMLITGQVASIEALAALVKQERRHVGRTLGLSFLSPEITRSILRGEQPSGLRLAHLLDVDIPMSWTEQRDLIGELVSG